jgi:nucleoside-diphosphate-sugar epimerase
MMEILHSWSDPRFEYSYLPATEASSANDLEKHSVELTAIYSTSMFGTKNYFHTIAGCYSFAREDLYEMFFMNLAAQSLRMNYYDQFRDFISISDFMRRMYPILQNCPGFDHIHQQIVDLYDPTTEARDLFYLTDESGQQRYKRDVIADFIASNDSMIRLLLVNELVI